MKTADSARVMVGVVEDLRSVIRLVFWLRLRQRRMDRLVEKLAVAVTIVDDSQGP